jgi:hypothetical protein
MLKLMRVFYRKSTDHLIFTPFRCGSSHLQISRDEYGLLNENEMSDSEYSNILKRVKKKTFIYRDPFERWISFYYGLVYIPRLCELGILDTDHVYEKYKGRIAVARNAEQLYFNPNCYYDLIESIEGNESFWEAAYTATRSLENIIKTTDDAHIFPQYTFFNMHFSKIECNTSEIISLKHYSTWINLTFNANLVHVSNLDYIKINLFDVDLINEIKSMCMDIYYKDYKYIFPLINNSVLYGE